MFCIPVVQVLDPSEEKLDTFIVQRLLSLDTDLFRINLGILCELSYRNNTFFEYYCRRLLKCLLVELKKLEKDYLQGKLFV